MHEIIVQLHTDKIDGSLSITSALEDVQKSNTKSAMVTLRFTLCQIAMAHNVSANNAVVARAQKSFIYQHAKRHNGATTIIHIKRWSDVVCRVMRCAATILLRPLLLHSGICSQLNLFLWIARLSQFDSSLGVVVWKRLTRKDSGDKHRNLFLVVLVT